MTRSALSPDVKKSGAVSKSFDTPKRPPPQGKGRLGCRIFCQNLSTPFLTHLAVQRKVSASTQTQALCALLYLYKEVLGADVGELEGLVRARRRRHLPVVLTRDEVRQVLSYLEGTDRLFLTLLYGTGLWLMEGLRLRVKDIDFAGSQITVRDGKGEKDRVTMLPTSVQRDLKRHLREVRLLHEKDLAEGFGRVELPYALANKYRSADREWGWQYVFPALQRSREIPVLTATQTRHN